MERLTSYKNDCKREMICRYENCDTCEEYCPDLNEDNCPCLQEILEKLAEYEDLEEQGKLLKPPCKVGDIIWVNGVLGVGEIEEYKVIKVDYHSTLGTERSEFYIVAILASNPENSMGFYDKEIGKTVFLTKSAAEQALKEKKDEEESEDE